MNDSAQLLQHIRIHELPPERALDAAEVSELIEAGREPIEQAMRLHPNNGPMSFVDLVNPESNLDQPAEQSVVALARPPDSTA